MIKLVITHTLFFIVGMIIFGEYWVAWFSDMPIKSILFPDTTIYSSEFTESKFKKIKESMTTDEVQSIIGYPIFREKECENTGEIVNEELKILSRKITLTNNPQKKCELLEHWHYSIQGPRYNTYEVRKLMIKKNNIVKIYSYTED